MKSFLHFVKLFVLVGFLMVLNACAKDPESDPPEPPQIQSVVRSYDLVKTYEANDIRLMFLLLASQFPEAEVLAEAVEYDVEVYHVVYRTRYRDTYRNASGLLCVPAVKTFQVPMLCFLNGTNTDYQMAPSNQLDHPLFQFLHTSASMGFGVLFPDYLGFGESEQIFHPYLNKSEMQPAILDFFLAGKELLTDQQTGNQWNGQAFMQGYSEGGWAGLACMQYLDAHPGFGIELTAAGLGAGPYDIGLVQAYILQQVEYPQPHYLPYVVLSYQAGGLITNPVGDFFQAPYADTIPSLYDGSLNGGAINSALTTQVENLVTEEFRLAYNTDPRFTNYMNALHENSVRAWNTLVPLRLYHGGNDDYVPAEVSQQLYQQFLAVGAQSVDLYQLADLDHGEAAIPSMLDALVWFLQLKAAAQGRQLALTQPD